MDLTGKKILVTGATGFIGGRICERFVLDKKIQVRAFVHNTARAARIARLPIETFQGDILTYRDVEKAIEGCSAVVHLAVGSRAVTIKGTKNLLKVCRKKHIERFVQLSSVRVYGMDPPPESRSESATARKTGDRYGDAKLLQELLARKYYRRYGLPVVTLRPPYVYGPYDHLSRTLVERLKTNHLP